MLLLVAALFGSAVFNSSFFRIGSGMVNILSLFIVLCGVTYLFVHFYNKKRGEKYLPSRSSDRFFWMFFYTGVISVIASYLGFYKAIASNDVMFDSSFIPRQAYYLFFIPLVILAGRHVQTPTILKWIQKNYRALFFLVYLAYIAVNRTPAIDVPCFFCLSTLLLMGRERNRAADVAMLLLIELSPIDTGGEMTQALCRIACLFLFFAEEGGKFLRPMVCFSVVVVLVCYILPFIPLEWIGLDANTSWRLQYWGDELRQLLKTFGVGVGFGTSYATQSFIGEAVSGPFAATAEYSVMERLYVVGCHNSFVSISFRLGMIGAVLLLIYIMSCSHRRLPRSRSNYLTYSIVSSIAVVCFNVGFESPMYFFLFAFSFAAFSAMTPDQQVATSQN